MSEKYTRGGHDVECSHLDNLEGLYRWKSWFDRFNEERPAMRLQKTKRIGCKMHVDIRTQVGDEKLGRIQVLVIK